MKNLVLTTIALIAIFSISLESVSQDKKSVVDMFPTSSNSTPNIWNKFVGENAPAGTPDLIDYSYAGYKNGKEAIPNGDGYRVINVRDYGAIPNDGLSDTYAIEKALKASTSGKTIVFFPPGQYDVITDGEIREYISVKGDDIIIRGSGAEGADKGGTTIKVHNILANDKNCLFLTGSQQNAFDHGTTTQIEGSFPRGTKHFDVADSSSLAEKRFLEIRGNNLHGEDWDDHCSRPPKAMPREYTDIKDGIDVVEIHEIDRIEGNRIYVKTPVLTPLNPNYEVGWQDLNVGIGFEDLHIEGGFNQRYEHLKHNGYGGIMLKYTAHSWIMRCRFSNVIESFLFVNSYCATGLANIVDGRFGHHSGVAVSSLYCLIGLFEDWTDRGVHHGITITWKSAGCVIWMVGGEKMRGPDTHGGMIRYTLFDNYYSRNHQGSGGSYSGLPHHLDGYTRWNNDVRSGGTFDLWNPGGYNFAVVQANIIGYRQNGGSKPRDAYVESFGAWVTPDSLYEGQLEKRLGYLPLWVNNAKEMHRILFKKVMQ